MVLVMIDAIFQTSSVKDVVNAELWRVRDNSSKNLQELKYVRQDILDERVDSR